MVEVLLVGYVGVSLLYWLWTAYGACRVAQSVRTLADQEKSEPSSWPSLSVIVPACNEEATLEAAVQSLLSQDYPDLRIVLINDRSDDATGEVVDRLGQDSRVLPLHITDLPEGWLGKVNAMNQGVENSQSDWVLFTDADVHFLTPDALRQAISWAESERLDHLAATPEMWPASILLDAMVSQFLRIGAIAARLWAVRDPTARAYIGIGAFNLVRREAFDRTPGLSWLRLEVVDDLGIGLMMKRYGGRSDVVSAHGLVGLQWYPTFRDLTHGLEKSYGSIAQCSLWRMLLLCAFAAALELSPFVALLPWGIPGLPLAGLAMLTLLVAASLVIQHWARRPMWHVLLAPVAVAVGVGLFLRSGIVGFLRGGMCWRGTLYRSKDIRKNARVRIGSRTECRHGR